MSSRGDGDPPGRRLSDAHGLVFLPARSVTIGAAARAFVLLLAGPWVILWNNARIGESVPTHVGYRWVPLIREVRLIEAALLLAVLAFSVAALFRSRIRLLGYLLLGFLVSGALGATSSGIAVSVQLQGLYVYVAPFFVFVVAWLCSTDRDLLRRLVRLHAACLAASAAVALALQLPEAGAKGDLVHGFYSDAHVLGTFLAVASCVCFFTFLEDGGLAWLAAAAGLFAASYFPANEKVIVFNVLGCVLAVGWRLLRRPRGWRGWVAAVAIVLAAAVAGGRDFGGSPPLRLDLVAGRSLREVGPVRAWRVSWGAVSDSALRLGIGFGPGGFAGVAAGRAIRQRADDPADRVATAMEVLTQSPGHDEPVAWATNTWSNLLAEFGVVGLVLFLAALGSVAAPAWRWKPVERTDRLARRLFLAMLAVVLWQGGFSPYTNWAEPVLVYPMMVAAAYCHRTAASA